MYRPPRDLNSDYRKFIDEFSEFLEEIENKNEIIIIGDFNINLLKINERELFFEFFDNLIAQGFLPKITFPTRFTRTNGTLIDNIFCKCTRSNTNIKSGILINKLSDHQPYFTILPAIQPIVRTRTLTQRHQINESTLHNVDIALQKSQIITKMELNLLSDPNINYNIMENEITNTNRKYILKKTVKSIYVALWTSTQGSLEEGTNGFTHVRNKRTKQNIRNDKLLLIIETHKPQCEILLNTHRHSHKR